MGMPLELNTMIVTKGNEERVGGNLFQLRKKGYRLYPLHVPVPVKKTLDGDISGTAVIEKVVWENQETLITYRLIALNSTN
ncbi:MULTISPECIES: DUF2584 domain-containing protein [Bacillus]|jgi:hypothetical protein|uniref:DUF2584 domain-containing protein n=1 Tax=Bacillus smithii 7_3_47FAA TaxID=665952 RepID=G9QHP5_9BACI|nr:DUF2584 domain-containing protein [Bacillus smithii]AKP48206.1 hypothetical protein BSM4216_2974 [Bacillus smithii]EHL79318.1 hypothetical protein HMPREF1015_03104 [Bacillus smithii 7_3_47FAA]MED0660424.1 DUF2584 domain-containing protein [Bacillus smithii]MED1418627.1 DUF2584 domain-containing protein [Bacillus smithii]MED1454733.1 DUF2584 domain-containing protein [Bacillus smithii]